MSLRSRLLSVLRLAARWDWLAVVLAAPFLVFPTLRPHWTAVTLVCLIVFWLMRWATLGELWPVTPFNGALLVFALAIPVGIWASAFPAFTIPKAAGLLLGVAVFRAMTLTVRNHRTLGLAVAVFCLLGLTIIAVGTLAAQWRSEVALLGALAERIPQLIATLPGLRTPGVNRNQLAAVLAFYLPLAAALLVGWPFGRERPLRRWLLFIALLGFLILVAGLLVLTQSRGGWIGGASGLLGLAVVWGLTAQPRWKRLIGGALPMVALATLAIGLLVVGPGQVAGVLYGVSGETTAVEEAVGSLSLAARIEIWSRALYAIQDFPFTGCGLGAFRRVVHILYPLFRIGPDVDIAHAHNIFLQTAVDLGFPGLIAYLALLMVAGAVCWRGACRRDPLIRPLALGIAGGLIALHTYGLADALALGSKPGVVFWFALGLAASLERLE